MRDLSAAHSSGLIDDDQYRSVRGEILNALEKNQPLPKIDYQNIQSASTRTADNSKKPYLLITFVLAVLLIVVGGMSYIQKNTQQQGIVIPITNIENRAMALLGSSGDDPKTFARFVATWDALSVTRREQLTYASWHPKLQAKLENKLAETQSQDEPDDVLILVIETTLSKLNSDN